LFGTSIADALVKRIAQAVKNEIHNNYQDFQTFLDQGGRIGLHHDPLLYGAYNLNPFLVSAMSVKSASLLAIEPLGKGLPSGAVTMPIISTIRALPSWLSSFLGSIRTTSRCAALSPKASDPRPPAARASRAYSSATGTP
jgi:hypothetical protein